VIFLVNHNGFATVDALGAEAHHATFTSRVISSSQHVGTDGIG
jgi:hypothetical protein